MNAPVAPSVILKQVALVSGAIAICGAIIASTAIGSKIHLARQAKIAGEIASENAQLCAGFGMIQPIRSYEQCVNDLNALRARHENRIRNEFTGIL